MYKKTKNKKSISVLVVLLLKMQGLGHSKRRRITYKIYDVLVEEGLVTRDEIVREETNFRSFVKDVARNMEEMEMSEEAAIKAAYNKYPQFSRLNLN